MPAHSKWAPKTHQDLPHGVGCLREGGEKYGNILSTSLFLSYLLSGQGSLIFQGDDMQVPCDDPEPNISPYTQLLPLVRETPRNLSWSPPASISAQSLLEGMWITFSCKLISSERFLKILSTWWQASHFRKPIEDASFKSILCLFP